MLLVFFFFFADGVMADKSRKKVWATIQTQEGFCVLRRILRMGRACPRKNNYSYRNIIMITHNVSFRAHSPDSYGMRFSET